MHGPINIKSPNNTSKWQMGLNSAFKGLIYFCQTKFPLDQAYSCVLEIGTIFNALSRTANRQNTMYSSQNNHNTTGLTIQIKIIQFSAERTVATVTINLKEKLVKIVDPDLQNQGFVFGQLCFG